MSLFGSYFLFTERKQSFITAELTPEQWHDTSDLKIIERQAGTNMQKEWENPRRQNARFRLM